MYQCHFSQLQDTCPISLLTVAGYMPNLLQRGLIRGTIQLPFLLPLGKLWFFFLAFYFVLDSVCAQLLQLCPTLCDSMDCSLPGSSVCRILLARILEWVAMLSSRGFSWPRGWTRISCISCFAGRIFTAKPLGKLHIGVQPINSTVTVSGGKQRNSAIHIHVSILPNTPLPSRLPHNIE